MLAANQSNRGKPRKKQSRRGRGSRVHRAINCFDQVNNRALAYGVIEAKALAVARTCSGLRRDLLALSKPVAKQPPRRGVSSRLEITNREEALLGWAEQGPSKGVTEVRCRMSIAAWILRHS